jgi:dephospho-CoA kinase
MTEERFEGLLARQTPDAEKRARADWVVPTGDGIPAARASVEAFLAELAGDRPAGLP